MAANFVNIDRDTPFLLPPDLKEWVADDDPVHFIIEAVMGLKINDFKVNHRGSGSKQYPPKELSRRQNLLAKLEAAKQQLEDEARDRAKAAGDPSWEQAAPDPKHQKNLTDGESRVMTKRKTTDQAYNAQATVDADGSMLILAAEVTQQSNDMGQLKPMVEAVDERVGKVTGVLADSGYAKAADIEVLAEKGLDLYVAVGRGGGPGR